MREEHGKRIPTELEIEILQYIADEDEDDRSRWLALVNCALVCKVWTGHVRSLLYCTIDMNNLRGTCQFERLRRYTHLRPFLRELTWPRTEFVQSLYCSSVSDVDIIKNIAPTVTKLRLCSVDYRSLTPHVREAISTFANIKELDMSRSIFEDWTAVVQVISSFPFLAVLAMPHVATSRDDSPEISYPPPSRLVHIKLASGCETETVRWIRKGSAISTIQTVEAESEIGSNVLATLLRSLGGGLRHLVIHIDSKGAFSHFGLASSNLILIENHSRRGCLWSICILLSPHRKHCP